MEVNLVHPSLNRVGGAERVLLEMLKSLSNTGHSTNLFTLDRVRWGQLSHTFGNLTRPAKECNAYDVLPCLDSFLNWGLIAISYLKLLCQANENEDGISINNYGEVFPFITDFSYIHAIPLFGEPRERPLNPYSVPFWNILSGIYRSVFSLMKKTRSAVLITNSGFNSEIIERSLGIQPVILSPPIRKHTSLQAGEKENVVMSLSRFSTTKMLRIIPEIARKVNIECRFVILGHPDTNHSPVLSALRSACQRLRVQDRVTVVINPGQEEIENWFRRASVYLSTQPTEAFGIAVAEAMSFGCVPIVPRSGGPWLDILKREQGNYGFSFGSISEASQLIERVLTEKSMTLEIRKRAKERVKEFSSESFSKSFVKLIETYNERKRSYR